MTLSRNEILARLLLEPCSGRSRSGSLDTPEWPDDFSIAVDIAADVIEELVAAERVGFVRLIERVTDPDNWPQDHGARPSIHLVCNALAMALVKEALRLDVTEA